MCSISSGMGILGFCDVRHNGWGMDSNEGDGSVDIPFVQTVDDSRQCLNL
jgi:hypothetical protein